MKKKVSTIFSFTVIPLVAAIIIGSSVKQIGTYLTKGLAMTTSVALIMLFSLPYFMLMADTGLFSGIVKRIVSRVRMNPVVLAILTVIVAMITGLDVSITSVYLITVPLLLPFYKKMKMQPVILVFLTSLGIINTFDVPWSARMLRSASLIPKIDNGTNYLFAKLFPPQIVLTVVIFGIAAFLGLKETRRLKKLGIDAAAAASGGDSDDVFEEDAELVQPKKFWSMSL
jgi:CitMHS family citrate-Mg2+:H+ or citrate-Ca2+:H+ symporter